MRANSCVCGTEIPATVPGAGDERGSAAFRLADIERACPGVGRDWIRALLARLRKEGKVVCEGRGRGLASERRVDVVHPIRCIRECSFGRIKKVRIPDQ